jgi:hypothetical protein
MRRILCLFLFLAVVIAPDCQTKQTDANTINVTGTVTHFDLEGGFWAVNGDDGKTYDPSGGLPTEFQKEGLRVRMEARTRPDMVSIHMVGTIVEIKKIERL